MSSIISIKETRKTALNDFSVLNVDTCISLPPIAETDNFLQV